MKQEDEIEKHASRYIPIISQRCEEPWRSRQPWPATAPTRMIGGRLRRRLRALMR